MEEKVHGNILFSILMCVCLSKTTFLFVVRDNITDPSGYFIGAGKYFVTSHTPVFSRQCLEFLSFYPVHFLCSVMPV